MNPEYHEWITRFDELDAEDVASVRGHASAAGLDIPLVVVRYDCRNESHVRASIDSLKGQLLEKWRAELYFDSHCSPRSVALAKNCALGDPRISIRTSVESDQPDYHGGVRSALFMCGAVRLRAHALYMLTLAASDREIALAYSDEDRCDETGERLAPVFKPVFSPELFRNANYLGNCVLVRAPSQVLSSAVSDFLVKHHDVGSLVDKIVPGIPPKNIIHVPHILFHDTIERRLREPLQGCHWLEGPLPSVSILIPTRDRADLLRPCLESIKSKTDYPRERFEVVLIDNDSRDEETLGLLIRRSLSNDIRLLRVPGAFNFSRINNQAAVLCRNDVLVFLNNDTVVIDPLWLRRLVSFAVQRDVAAVGCKLLHPDGTVQHGGVVVGIRGSAVHCHVGLAREDPGFQGLANVTREVAAVTAACMAIRRDVFEELGGFDERLAIAFNDTDLCLRALSGGYRNIYISEALLIHHEGRTRGQDNTAEKISVFRQEAEITRMRHTRFFKRDPYYSPNLSVDRLYELACPPRRTKPWRDYARLGGRLRVLFLSLPHRSGHRVSYLIAAQAKHLVAAGYDVFWGGPRSDAEPACAGCRRIEISLPKEAASFAIENDIDCIIAHDAPFFSVARWTGDWPKVICCDHGELPRELFGDERELIELEKQFAFSLAHCVITAPSGEGSSAQATQMLESLADLKSSIELLSAPARPSAACRPNSSWETLGGNTRDLSEKSPGHVGECSSLEETDRREFYARLRHLNGRDLVDQAYLAILGRYADERGRAHYIDQLSRGVSRDRVVWEMAHSEEARRRGVCASEVMTAAGLSYLDRRSAPGTLNDEHGREWPRVPQVKRLLRMDGEDFIYSAYVTVLGRLPDAAGLEHYLTELQSGASKLEIVSRLRNSSEGRKRRMPLNGYRRLMLRRRFRSVLGAEKQR